MGDRHFLKRFSLYVENNLIEIKKENEAGLVATVVRKATRLGKSVCIYSTLRELE